MKNTNISKINISSFEKINDYLGSKIDQSGKEDEKLIIEAKFPNYCSLMWDIEGLVKVVNGLSQHSNLPDEEILDSISVVTRLILKIFPKNDMIAFDSIIIPGNDSHFEKDFVSIKEINKK